MWWDGNVLFPFKWIPEWWRADLVRIFGSRPNFPKNNNGGSVMMILIMMTVRKSCPVEQWSSNNEIKSVKWLDSIFIHSQFAHPKIWQLNFVISKRNTNSWRLSLFLIIEFNYGSDCPLEQQEPWYCKMHWHQFRRQNYCENVFIMMTAPILAL